MRSKAGKGIGLLIVAVVLMLPFSSALQISNVRAEEVTDASALIRWNTDEPADSIVYYGLQRDALQGTGDATPIVEHAVPVRGLSPATEYLYRVESSSVVDDHAGNYYQFTTLGPDTDIPQILAELPAIIQGNHLDIEGRTEANARVDLFLNGGLIASTSSVAEGLQGVFRFPGVTLHANELNRVNITVRDAAGNTGSIAAEIFADTEAPQLILSALPNITDQHSLSLNGTVSENSTIIVTVDEQAMREQEGTSFSTLLRLQEGNNDVKVTATDKAGWQAVHQQFILSDTRPPTVRFELVEGTEYYEGRADTDITGETEPGAAVYVYVFRQGMDITRSQLQHAVARTTADSEGKFTFAEVSFPPPAFTSLEELAPREVPPGLEEIVTSPAERIAEQDRRGYKVIIIAEDATGKTGYSQKVVNVNTCFSGNYAFDVSPHAEFPPMPFRLDPGLMEEGREQIQALFEVRYRGQGAVRENPRTGQIDQGYRINTLVVEKACTREMSESDDYSLGCRLLPGQRIPAQANQDNSAVFITSSLNPAKEFLEKENNVWDDFVSKRQLKFPLKIKISYSERNPDGSWGETKSQPFCYDLGYFVDRPIDSEDLVPDFLAEEGVAALNWTISQIETVKPYLEKAVIVSGVSCVGSFLTKTIARFYRFFISHFEPWMTKISPTESGCPKGAGQYNLYLESTLESWRELKNNYRGEVSEGNLPDWVGNPAEEEQYSLDQKCPQTAAAWKFEETIDKLYQFTCDRFLCRPVPARWTENANEEQVKKVLDSELSCPATANCAVLREVENCQEKYQENPAMKEFLSTQPASFSCYVDAGGTYYLRDPDPDVEVYGIRKLKALSRQPQPLQEISKPTIFAYEEEDSGQFCIAEDVKCDTKCRLKEGYRAARDGYAINNGRGCYKEDPDDDGKLKSKKDGNPVSYPKVAMSYTKDCFLDLQNPDEGKYQCVCEPEQRADATPREKARTAVQRDPETGTTEEYSFREDRIYAESGRKAGTYYPAWRYYAGRDFSGGFGLNWGFDNFKPNDAVDQMSVTKVDPHTQYLSTFQSMCLRGMLARLNMLESVLVGMRNCILQAKYTGLQDAGMCKTIFTQYVCGLMYKAIAYLGSSCSPLSFKDVKKGPEFSESGIKEFFDAGFNAIPTAMQSSIDEVNSDYGDANFQQFFATGAQGFTESLCLAAFGYDFPMGMDFIQDTAYSFSTEISAIFPIAERELATFDPVRGTAVFNYHVAGTMFPGCKVRGYRTSLTCVGPEDLGHPDVDRSCLGQGCDCLQASGTMPELQGEREHLLQDGARFGDVPKGQVYDFPLPSPQKVSSNFRYDHLMLEVTLDNFEDSDKCFPSGYQTATGGKFYFPIRDISPPVSVNCFADPTSGRFICPQIKGIFGGGGTYLEHPFVQCYDQRRDDFFNCENPNVLLVDDDIVIKPYLYLSGEEPACLQVKDNRGLIDRRIPLPEHQPGPYTPRLNLGKVAPELISGGRVGAIITDPSSDPGCGGNAGQVEVLTRAGEGQAGGSLPLQFQYFPQGNEQYQLKVPAEAVVEPQSGYGKDAAGFLTLNAHAVLTISQIDAAIFTAGGFRFSKVLGTAQPQNPPNGLCMYRINPARVTGRAGTVGSVSLTLELLKPGPNENCWTTRTTMPKSNFGDVRVSKTLLVQSELAPEPGIASASQIHQLFERGEYDAVIGTAQAIVEQQGSNLEEAIAIYYWVASLVMQGIQLHQDELVSMLGTFFTRQYTRDTALDAYTPEVTNALEYQKIKQYLCEVDNKVGGRHQSYCVAGLGRALSLSLCGKDTGLRPGFAPPLAWEQYSCRNPAAVSDSARCVGHQDYVPDGHQDQYEVYGCFEGQLCCPS